MTLHVSPRGLRGNAHAVQRGDGLPQILGLGIRGAGHRGGGAVYGEPCGQARCEKFEVASYCQWIQRCGGLELAYQSPALGRAIARGLGSGLGCAGRCQAGGVRRHANKGGLSKAWTRRTTPSERLTRPSA